MTLSGKSDSFCRLRRRKPFRFSSARVFELRMPAGAENRDPYPAGEYNRRLLERAEKGMVADELVDDKELELEPELVSA